MEASRQTSQQKTCRVLITRDGTNDAEWLRLRRETGVGASEAPIICGMSPYGSLVKLYGQKLGLIEPDDENKPMRRGKRFEALILEEYAEESKRHATIEKLLLQSCAYPHMLATPDAAQYASGRAESGLVQIKMTALAHEWKEGVPPRVWCQMQHEFAVTGKTWGTAVAFLAGREVVWGDVERDDEFIDGVLIPRCKDFWSRVVEKDGIPRHWIDGSDDEFDALKKLYPERLAESAVELDAELLDTHARLQEMKALVKTAESEIKAMENRLRLAIGEHTYGRFASGLTYSLKTQTRAEHVVKACTFRVLRLMKGTVN